MENFITFIANHVFLSGAFVLIFLALVVHEFYYRVKSGRRCSAQDLVRLSNQEKGQVVDLREKSHFNEGHIAGALHIPSSILSTQFDEKVTLSKEAPVILVDSQGEQGHSVSTLFRKKGFSKVYFLGGGIAAWREAHLPLVKK